MRELRKRSPYRGTACRRYLDSRENVASLARLATKVKEAGETPALQHKPTRRTSYAWPGSPVRVP